MSSGRSRPPSRGLVMPPGRGIPRPPAARPDRAPAPSPDPDAQVPDDARRDLEKAAGELQALASAIRACVVCGPPEASRVFGSGSPCASVFLLKDVPSPVDVQSASAFTSEAEALEKAFDALQIPMSWVYGATAVRCGTADAEVCATHLLVEIEAVAPAVLVAFGPGAVEAIRKLDGRCGIEVPDEVPDSEPVRLRHGLVLVATESLPEGLRHPEAKRRLWRDLRALKGLVG